MRVRLRIYKSTQSVLNLLCVALVCVVAWPYDAQAHCWPNSHSESTALRFSTTGDYVLVLHHGYELEGCESSGAVENELALEVLDIAGKAVWSGAYDFSPEKNAANENEESSEESFEKVPWLLLDQEALQEAITKKEFRKLGELGKVIKKYKLMLDPSEVASNSSSWTSPNKDAAVVLDWPSGKHGSLTLYTEAEKKSLLDIPIALDISEMERSGGQINVSWSPRGTMLVIEIQTHETEMCGHPDENEDGDESDDESDDDDAEYDEEPCPYGIESQSQESSVMVVSMAKYQGKAMSKRRMATYLNAVGFALRKAESGYSERPEGSPLDSMFEEFTSPLEAYKLAMKTDPSYEMSIYNAACEYQRAEDSDEAYKLLERLKAMKTSKARARLKRARRDLDFKSLRKKKRFRKLVHGR